VRAPQRGNVRVGASGVLHEDGAAAHRDAATQAVVHRHAHVVLELQSHRAHHAEALAVLGGQQDQGAVGLQHVTDALEHAAQEVLLGEVGERGLGDRLQALDHLGGRLHLVARDLLAQQQLVALRLEAPVLGHVDHDAAQTAPVGRVHPVAQPDLAAVGGRDAELVLERPLGGQGLAVARQHTVPVARVHDLAPEVRGAQPALDGIAEQVLGALADEGAGEGGSVGFPDDGVDAVNEITEPTLRRVH